MRCLAAVALRVQGGFDWLCEHRAWTLPAAIGAVALLLRLYRLGDKPFWLDEVTSLRRATATVPDLVADALHNAHYPSYFLLLWLVAKLGTSQWLLRLPSALCGAAAAGLGCAIGSKVSDERGGAIAGLLMAVSPFEVQFGQEARSYTLVSCLILTALYGLIRLAQQPAAAALPLTRRDALHGAWTAYSLGTAAALAVLNVAIPWFVAANVAALVIARAANGVRPGFWRNWAMAQLLILMVWAPLLVAVYVSRHGAVLDGADWAPAETSRTLWSIIAPVYLLRISSFITFDVMPGQIPGLALVVVAAAALGAWRLRREPAVLAVLGCAALVLPLGLVLISRFVPLLVPRYFAWGAGPFFIFAGAGLGQLTARRFAAASVMLGVAGWINLVPYYSYETKPRWDLLAKKLAEKTRPGDIVLVNNYYAYSLLSLFAARAGLDEHKIKLTWDLPKAEQVAPGRDVWAVYGRTGQAARQPAENYERSLAALGHPVVENSVGRYIVLWRYAEPNGPDPAALSTPPRDHSDLSMRDAHAP
ncbi:MAG TPA: glycosyltransferase family 39 protein [Stellaceae bacterium]|nr:glycosyltransferase family 39 protein [Stellaceae bacterium]